ncbi:hypothetical protein [Duganella sp. BuS-21]|uniref:hypothetical protein n=1 Tax=Duganella sp. BuS-21 TaxID=2943848 RepID=UPI0035A6B3D4
MIDRGVFHPDAADLERTLGRAEGFILDAKRIVYVSAMRVLLAALRAQDGAKIEEMSMKTLLAQFGIFDAASVKLENFQMDSAKALYEDSQSFFSGFTKGYTMALMLGVALLIFSAVRLLRAILHPLQKALGHFDQIAAGNLDLSRAEPLMA